MDEGVRSTPRVPCESSFHVMWFPNSSIHEPVACIAFPCGSIHRFVVHLPISDFETIVSTSVAIRPSAPLGWVHPLLHLPIVLVLVTCASKDPSAPLETTCDTWFCHTSPSTAFVGAPVARVWEAMADGATVLDNGTSRTKASLAFVGDEEPRAVAPTAVRRKGRSAEDGMDAVYRPMERKSVRNWDQMEAIWHHLFYDEVRERRWRDAGWTSGMADRAWDGRAAGLGARRRRELVGGRTAV
eukprot:scaffold64_cov338-Pavlova_lutheri.AAC.68